MNNVGYEGRCLRCSENAVYVGETSKTAYTRIKQHFSNYRAAAAAKLPPLQRENPGRLENVRDCKSWMWEHTRDEHDGVVTVLDTSDGNIMLSLDGGCTGCSSTPMTAMQIYYSLKKLEAVNDVIFVNGELPEYMRTFINQKMEKEAAESSEDGPGEIV